MKHHASLRQLAQSWIEILFRVRKIRTPFDCTQQIEILTRRQREIILFLDAQRQLLLGDA